MTKKRLTVALFCIFISKLGIEHGGYDLVGRDRRPSVPGRVWLHKVDGWYVYSNISNEIKAEDLKI